MTDLTHHPEFHISTSIHKKKKKQKEKRYC